jgi:hypothetical protein
MKKPARSFVHALSALRPIGGGALLLTMLAATGCSSGDASGSGGAGGSQSSSSPTGSSNGSGSSPTSSGTGGKASGSASTSSGGASLNADQQHALDLVNAARKEVNDHHLYAAPGAHSEPIGMATWSTDIEALAQTWANAEIQNAGCSYQHAGYDNPNNPGNLGEDLYSWTGDDVGILARGIQAFIDEKADYVYDWKGPFKNPADGPMEPMPFDAQSVDATPNDPALPENQGKQIGHYTVIIWRDMSQFACAYASKPGCQQVVCRFGPNQGINSLGVAPY